LHISLSQLMPLNSQPDSCSHFAELSLALLSQLSLLIPRLSFNTYAADVFRRQPPKPRFLQLYIALLILITLIFSGH